MWNFEKKTIPEDEDEKEALAFALAKYNISAKIFHNFKHFHVSSMGAYKIVHYKHVMYTYRDILKIDEVQTTPVARYSPGKRPQESSQMETIPKRLCL